MIPFLIEYVLLLLFLSYICFLLYIKTQSPFWFHQPVHHTTMIYPRTIGYWSKPYIIKSTQQIKPNLYSDFFHIQTYAYADLPSDKKASLLAFIQAQYLDSEDFIYDITEPVLDIYFTGQKHQTFVSFYHKEILREHRTKASGFSLKTSFEKDPICSMITAQQYIWFLEWNQESATNQSLFFPIYTWNYNCTHRDYKSQNLSRNMIQTHLYNIYQQSSVPASIFKKEVTLCVGITPFVQYLTYTFFIKKTPITKLPLGYKIKRLDARTINAWVELYTQIPHMQSIFDVCLMPSLSNTMKCIEKETHYVLLLLCTLEGKENIKGVYVFKDTYTVWDKLEEISTDAPKRTIQCVSSICYDLSQTLYFFRGFVHCVKELYYQKKNYGVLSIEHNSHNGIILQRWNEKYSMHMSTQTAYYLYNMVYPKSPIKQERFFTFN